MSLWSRIANVFRQDRLNADLDEEMQSHVEEASDRGRNLSEARKAFGSALHHREESRDATLYAWLDSLRSDTIFGWRQLLKNKAASGAAIVSLALAIGSCTSAFRLIDAVLLRPLPVSDPDQLRLLTYTYQDEKGKPGTGEHYDYPFFRLLRTAVREDAEVIAISGASNIDITYGSDQEMEKAYRQYVSGWIFPSFGLKPALGRLLMPSDDVKPGGHAYAVLSHDYWTRRFGQDPKVVGRSLHIGDTVYEIVGVCEPGFTGTETGTMTDLFVPTMMNARAIDNSGWAWFRTWVRMKPGASEQVALQKMQAAFSAHRRERAKSWSAEIFKQRRGEEYINTPLQMETAAAGVSGMQRGYRRALLILGVIAALVLLIACANVANLMAAQTASRAREMALRVSIGAGRSRLVQLVLVEGALVALFATVLGGLFAWRAAPLVVGMINPPDNPARLALPADWRVLGFSVALACAVTFLFGLAPALRASGVKPMATLRGGEDPHSRRRLIHGLIAAQVAFCFLVHFVAGLFVATFDRLSHQPTGFTSERLLALETVGKNGQPAERWDQVAAHLRQLPGVESVALCSWALMSGNGWTSTVWINGQIADEPEPYFLNVSPGWLDTMRIPLRAGRDFRPEDTYGVAVVNEAFAKRFFGGENPVGKSFQTDVRRKRVPVEIIGVAADARYRNMRDPIRPTVYVPFRASDPKDWGTLMVRSAGGNPLVLAPLLRKEVARARPEFRVTNVNTQVELVARHTIRERLLALLSLFFSSTALVLAAVGLYGVLTYSVLQRRREIGIRMALGAPAGDVVRSVTREIFAMLLIGAATGLVAGVASEQYVESLLFAVRVTDPSMLLVPVITIFGAALLAALPPVIRAVRLDPAQTLRAE
ncbi:MAG: ABC transporter permease [Acidobacteria bacterium]|nr:ABC transporter permease [Acidobacteriota bacterium]